MPVLSAITSPEFLVALSSILFLNLILSGDNAVIIAMASKNLPKAREKGHLLGQRGCRGFKSDSNLYCRYDAHDSLSSISRRHCFTVDCNQSIG